MKIYIKYMIPFILLLLLVVGLAGSVHAADTRLRVVHASPDAPAADIYLDGNLFVGNLDYRNFSNYQSLPPGNHRVKVLPAGSPPDSAAVIEADLPFAEGRDYTLVAMGRLENLEFRQFEDNNTPPEGANKARVRIIHASPNTPALDVCVTGHSACPISNLIYTNATVYAAFDAGIYSLDVRQTGTGNVFLTVPNLRFDDGFVYTVYLMGILNDQPPLQIIISVDARRTTPTPTPLPPPDPPGTGALLAPEILIALVAILVILGVGLGFAWYRLLRN